MMMNYSLLPYNTFGIDVKAKNFFEYSNQQQLREWLKGRDRNERLLHIGGGSNLLFLGDFNGTIIHSAIKGIEVVEENEEELTVKVGAAEVWDDFVAYAVDHGWYGIENLSLIPGEVGASAVQNIGAYGVEAKDVIVKVQTLNLDGDERIFENEECGYAYRKSIFKQKEMKGFFVTYVYFRLSKKENFRLGYGTVQRVLSEYPKIDLPTVREAIIRIREDKLPDPRVIGNAGSFFMNPIVEEAVYLNLKEQYPDMPSYQLDNGMVKIPAGWLIDQCGWKGRSLGRAGVYEKQALVLVNRGGATGEDIRSLSDAIRNSVEEKFGIKIFPEVNFIEG